MSSSNWLRWLHQPPWLGDCLLCLQPTLCRALLCEHCAASLDYLTTPCPGCGYPLPPGSTGVCGDCLRHPPRWRQMRVIADYQGAWQFLVHQFKYQRQPEIASLLGQLFHQHQAPLSLPQALLPVPMHPWRQWWRGYNQAQELTLALGREYRLPVDMRALRRIRATRSQVGLTRTERRQNLHGAFRVRELPWRHVALVDDVITTGSTMESLCQLLRQAGVEEIEVWAICRTQPPQNRLGDSSQAEYDNFRAI